MNNNIGVAVLDTGIYKHIDFGNRIIAFKDFINNRAFPYDDSGHGTHVSGIIAGDGYASHGRFKGIAPMSQIISVKVLDSNGNGNIENVIKFTSVVKTPKTIYNITSLFNTFFINSFILNPYFIFQYLFLYL